MNGESETTLANPQADPGQAPAVERHYTPAQVAELLGILPISVRRLVKLGRLRAVRLVREIRVPESALREFMAGLPDAREIPEQYRRAGRELFETRMEKAAERESKARKRGKAKR